MPRLNREESQARTRELLIEAARSEIVKKGFALASVRDIADAAGFSQGAFYSNFPDKEAILLELVQQHQTEERARIEAALKSAEGNAASAMAGIEKWSATVNSDPGFAVLAIELQLQALRSPGFAATYNELNRTAARWVRSSPRCSNCSARWCRESLRKSPRASSRSAAAWRCCRPMSRHGAADRSS
jgi:AcrR family transcriptional regulator